EERHSLFKKWLRTPGSPLSRFHFLFILLRFSGEQQSYVRLIRRIIKSLSNERSQSEFEGFLAILKWVNEEFFTWQEAQNWSGLLKLALAWAHAHELYTVFASIGAPIEWIQELFTNWVMQRQLGNIFVRNSKIWNDVAHPRHVSEMIFLVAGLFYIFGNNTIQEFRTA